MDPRDDHELAKTEADYGVPRESQPCIQCGRPTIYGPMCERCAQKQDRNGELLGTIGALGIAVLIVWAVVSK